jgi:hypothetical protein
MELLPIYIYIYTPFSYHDINLEIASKFSKLVDINAPTVHFFLMIYNNANYVSNNFEGKL